MYYICIHSLPFNPPSTMPVRKWRFSVVLKFKMTGWNGRKTPVGLMFGFDA